MADAILEYVFQISRYRSCCRGTDGRFGIRAVMLRSSERNSGWAYASCPPARASMTRWTLSGRLISARTYFCGRCRIGGRHSLRWDAVSSCLIFLSSWFLGRPFGSSDACSSRRLISSAIRSSNEYCLEGPDLMALLRVRARREGDCLSVTNKSRGQSGDGK